MVEWMIRFQDFTGVSLNEIPIYIVSFSLLAGSIYLWKNEK